jgi:hypothetical protein
MQILNLSATINVASLEPSINTYRLGEGAGTYEYPELNNKPKINGVTLVGDISSANLGIKTSDLANDSGYISEADIPTATSDLVNDSGFVNATQVQEVVSDAIPSDISYFDNDVGYITNADIGNIPTRTSQLENDSGYITAAEAPVVSVNNMTGAVILDGSNIEYEQNVSLNSKIDAVEADIPTATSELENDSGFITNASIPTRTSQLVNDSGFVNAQNIPVQSVNGETGAVELTATDIDYDSNNTVAAKIDANAQAIDSNAQSIGDLSTLATADKLSLVRAVNEIASYTPVYGNTASGAIATFDTSLALPLQDCTIDIQAVQAGSGTPSPDNVRAISGFDSGVITVTDNDQITNTYTVDFGQTVYGGRLNVTTGVLTVTHDIVDLGTLTWKKAPTGVSGASRYWAALNGTKDSDKTDSGVHSYCSGLVLLETGQTYLANADGYTIASSVVYVYLEAYKASDATTFKNAMSGIKLVYELATPIEIQLTPVQVKTLLGNNNIFADTNGDTSVVYVCSLKDYIDRQ